MPLPRSTLIAGAAAALALVYGLYQHQRARGLADELARATAEQARLQAALATSEKSAADLRRDLAEAERRSAELQRKLTAPAVTPPRPARPPAASPANEAQRQRAEKMARLKPLLERGVPIRGAAVIIVGGKAVPQPVELVIGRLSRVVGDDGTYTILPTLQPDGSVKYELKLIRTEPGTGLVSVLSAPGVIQTPWDSFTVNIGGGRVFAFDPDQISP